MSDLLKTYDWNGNEYLRIPGTADWVEVALLGDGGGWEWTDFNAFYSPSARRYFWHGDSGCSCNSWADDLVHADSFENGDRAALLRAWKEFAKDRDYSIGVTGYTDGVETIRNFKENN